MTTRVCVTNQTRGAILGRSVMLADSWMARLRGYLGRPAPAQGEGLLMTPCQGVHMYGLGYALDIVFLDRQGKVIALYPGLAPRRRTALHADANSALELPPGTIGASGTQLEDFVAWKPVPEAGKRRLRLSRRLALRSRSVRRKGSA